MTESDQITVYSCHLCGFCETSLPALTKHTASHIKSEQSNDHSKSSAQRSYSLMQQKDVENMNDVPSDELDGSGPRVIVGSNGTSIVVVSGGPRDTRVVTRERANTSDRLSERSHREINGGFTTLSQNVENEDDDDIIVVHERQKSPQVGDVFPSSSGSSNPHSRVFFPSGWNESTTSRNSTIRMPNNRHRIVLQSSSATAQEHRDRLMPKIINYATVGHRNQQRGYVVSNGVENTGHQEQTGFITPTYEMGQIDADLANEVAVRPAQPHRTVRRGTYVVSSTSPVIHEVFSRPPGNRSRDVHVRNHSNHGNRSSEPAYPQSSPNSAFVPFGTHISQQVRHNYPSYQEMRSSRSNQQGSQPHETSHSNGNHSQSDNSLRARFDCPIPIPNNGTVVMNPNQPVMLPPYGNHDGLSGILVIPLKKTNEIGIQTDESCLSPEYMQYRPPQAVSSDPQPVNLAESSSSLKCSVCDKEFQDTQKLRQHFEASHSKDSLRCKDCGQIFLTTRNMQMHKVRVHNKRMPFRCGVCGVRFENRTSVVQHLSTHNASEYIFRCDTCGKRFGNEEKLRKHEEKHQDMWHKCKECYKSFGSEVTLAYHMEQVHKKQHNRHENEAAVNNGAPAQASQNEDLQPQNQVAIVHEGEANSAGEMVTVGDDLTCEFCNVQFNNSKDLEEHIKDCSLGKTMKKMFRCAVCQTFFALQSQLVNHYNAMHHSRDGYMCSKCPRKFRLWSRLKLHIKAFHQTKKSTALKNVCSVCSEKFMSRNKLEDHLRQVHQIQPFQSKVGRVYTCKECKKRFTNLSSLMVHRRGVHSLNILESPSTQTWKCQYCNIERLTKKTYIAHLKEVHDLSVVEKGRSLEIVGKESGVTVVQQDNSDALFSPDSNREPSDFSLPEKDVDSNAFGELSCKECGANFNDTKRLKNHLGLVHGQKPFSCGTCRKRFSYSGQLSWHVREHNNLETTARQSGSAANRPESTSSSTGKGSDIIVTSSSDGAISVEQAVPPHTCIHCNTTYQNEKRLNNHLGMRHGYKNFECDVCSQKFSYSTHLIWHRRSHFPDKKKDNGMKPVGEENLITDQPLSEVSLASEELGSSFEDSRGEEASLKITGDNADVVTYRQPSRFVCGQCGADFNEEEQFRGHMIEVHSIEAERVEEQAVGVGESHGIGSYVCEICNKQLSTQIGWKVHRTRVHKLADEKVTLNSPPASNQFSYPKDLDTAVGGRSEDQSAQPKKNELGSEDLSQSAVYSCTKCSRVFTGLRSLRTHQFKLHAIRVKEVQHKAPQAKDDATLFSRVKSGEIFQCGTCDYQFSSEKGRKIHCKKMRHAEKRGSFSQANSGDTVGADGEIIVNAVEIGSPSSAKRQKLNENIADSDFNDISLCEICGTEFPNLNELKLHFQEMHPDEFSFPEPDDSLDLEVSNNAAQSGASPLMIECPRCDRSFPSRKAINAHMVKFHKIKGAALVRSLKEGRNEAMNTSSQDPLDLSLGSNHLAELDASEAKGFKVCPVCQRAFHNRRGLTMHLVRYHHMNKIGIQRFNLGGQFEEGLPVSTPLMKKPALPLPHSTGLKEHCPLCPMKFPSKRSLGTHIFKRHGIRCKQLSPAERRSLFSGTMYPRTDGEPSMVNREILVATDCPICGGKFVGKRGLRAHVSRIHGLDKVELGFMFPDKNATDDEATTQCNECDRVFNNKRIFAAHLYFVHKRETVETNMSDENITENLHEPHRKLRAENFAATADKSTEEGNEIGAFENAAGEDAEQEHLASDQDLSMAPNTGNTSDTGSGLGTGSSSKPGSKAFTEEYCCTDPSCDRVFQTPLELLVHVREKNGRGVKDIDKEVKNVNNDEAVEEQDENFDYDYVDDDEIDAEDDVSYDEQGNSAEFQEETMEEDENMAESLVGEATCEKFICFVCKTEHEDEKSFKEHHRKFHGKTGEDAEKIRDMMERNLLQNEAISKEYSLRETASRKAFRSEIELTEQILNKSPGQGPEYWEEEAFMNEGEPDESRSRQIISRDDQPGVQSEAAASDESEVAEKEVENTGEAQRSSEGEGDDDEPAKKSAFAAALNLQVMS